MLAAYRPDPKEPQPDRLFKIGSSSPEVGVVFFFFLLRRVVLRTGSVAHPSVLFWFEKFHFILRFFLKTCSV